MAIRPCNQRPANKPSQDTKATLADIFSKSCNFLRTIAETNYLIFKQIDSISLIQFSATCKFNRVYQESVFKVFPKASFEIAALKLWLASLTSEKRLRGNNHFIAQTSENFSHYAKLCLNQIEKILDSIQTLPDKATTLMRIASALGGMHSADYSKVEPTLKRLIQIIKELSEKNELQINQQKQLFSRIFKLLCNDLDEALNYINQTDDKYKAHFDIAESFSRTNNLKAFEYIKKLSTHTRGRLLCNFLKNARLKSKEKTLILINLVSNIWDLLDSQWTDNVACELAQSYMFVDDFDSACGLADKFSKTSKKSRIIAAIANQCDPKAAETYQILTKLLEWTKQLSLQLESEAGSGNTRYLKEARVSIAVKMSQLTSSKIPNSIEIWQENYTLYKEDDWVMMKMIQCIAMTDIKEAKSRANEWTPHHKNDFSYKIHALISLAEKLCLNIKDQDQAAEVLESAFLECSHLPKNPCTQTDIGRLIDCCYVESLINIAQCFSKIDRARAKEIFAIALKETQNEDYPLSADLSQKIAKTYAILNPDECIQFIQSDEKRFSEYKAFQLSELSHFINNT